jgi:hypothetical protein
MQASSGQTRTCVQCGRAIAFDVNVCPYCGKDYRAGADQAAKPKEDSILPVVGGVLVIIGALIYFYWAYGLLWAGDALDWMPFDIGGVLTACGVILLIMAIVSVLGAVFAIMRQRYNLAVLGAVFSILSLIGIVGLILVIVGKDGFKK